MANARLTDAERAVLDEIRRRPFSSQKDLAASLCVARTTVATYVERLQTKGYLLGRAYVLADDVDVCCIGGVTMDRTMLLRDRAIGGTSNPAAIHDTPGGVARNVAENLARLSARSRILSVIGDDDAGRLAIAATQAAGVDTDHVSTQSHYATGSYSAVVEPSGELHIGVSDLDVCRAIDRAFIDRHWGRIASATLVFADANLPAETLRHLCDRCRDSGLRLAVDTVSVPKAKSLPADLAAIEFLFCNLAEARALIGEDSVSARQAAKALTLKGARTAIVSAGARGAWLANGAKVVRVRAHTGRVVDVSGAGDALIAATLYGVIEDLPMAAAVELGMAAAWLTVQTTGRHSSELSAAALERHIAKGCS